jgi:hypothetical protein
MNPFEQYHQRYQEIKTRMAADLTEEAFPELIWNQPARLNNLFMAGLGMGTLFLRMGAVIQMCRKLHDGDTSNDALFMKQVMDNLRETLPSDTNWKNLWYASMQAGTEWEAAIPRDNRKNTVLDRFVTFRNMFVHQRIRLVPDCFNDIRLGLQVLDEMEKLYALFQGGEIRIKDDKYFWNRDKLTLELHPFVQHGYYEGLPYLFQGLYDQKKNAKFINTFLGDETEYQPNAAIQSTFHPMLEALRGGAGEVFRHEDRLKYYLECFEGREREVQAVLDWVQGDSVNNVLPIYSEAGMGKGALTAGIIDDLIGAKVPVMYHFCGSGMANSLHAILYHFILQGIKNMPGMPDGQGVWRVNDVQLQSKLKRLPSRYYDAIVLFQNLLEDYYQPAKQYRDKPLVIIIDGLDEAAVANSQLKISDWFYVYNDKDEIDHDWKPPGFIKWIFTYRILPGKTQEGYNLGEMPLLQPLKGLGEEAVREALRFHNVSQDFVSAVLEKGAIA